MVDILSELKVAVIVPHQDDELNIAGQLLPYFTEAGSQVKILFSTNGDAHVREGAVRYHETVAATAVIGVAEEDLVWLGYPDCKTSAHLYHDRFEDVAHPERMMTKCYGPVETLTKRMTGAEKPVCRASMLADIGLFLSSWRPDVIIAIDYDSHPDHRALSLLFEEALSRVIAEDPSYRPYVLKKFAYVGCWYGPDDYYKFAETQNVGDGCHGGATGNPYLFWGDRVRFVPHSSCLTPKLRDNVIYKAAKEYKSQVPWPNMARVGNGDVVYWRMRTDNLVYGAEVAVSSGDMAGLLDLRRFGVKDITEPASGENLDDIGWRADGDDLDPWIRVTFGCEIDVRIVEVLPSVFNGGDVAVEVLADGKVVGAFVTEPGRAGCLVFDSGIACRELMLRIGKRGNEARGIVEVGVYGPEDCDAPGLPLFDSGRSFGMRGENRVSWVFRKGYFWMLKKGKKVRRRLALNGW